MKKILCVLTVIFIMTGLLVFSSSAADIDSEMVFDIRSQRLQNYVDAVEEGTCTPMRHTMTESLREVFASVLPAIAAVALWISARISADLIVFLIVLSLLYFIVGGKRRVKDH